jgi:hypothetical protein
MGARQQGQLVSSGSIVKMIELEDSWRISERVSELLAERDAANVLILPTFSVPLMTHGRTAFVQDDAEAARTQWRPHEETQSAQRERRLDHRAGLAQPLRIETAHDDLRADARRIAHGDGDRSPKRPPRRSS